MTLPSFDAGLRLPDVYAGRGQNEHASLDFDATPSIFPAAGF
jgi:hypothetical protein